MSSEGHIFAELPENKGKWVHDKDDSSTDYRRNGHKATLADPSRCNRYKTPKRIEATLRQKRWKPSRWMQSVSQFSPQHLERYYFDFIASYIYGKRAGQAISNFARGGAPYANEAHHLIPQAKFLALFPEREEQMLKRVDYNVHNGRNIIFLPEHSPDCGFHNLPYHSGSHDAYDNQVQLDAKELSQKLKDLGDNACDDEVVLNIKDRLMALQEDYWAMLAKAGAVAVRDVRWRQEMP
ncbi:AHH domain-containing protein [Archangium sp.]|uniref:AHH domain-containing protein n=1 Tax=Archangium sp. TaxID=1872627 RepID=UPI00389AD564